MTQKLDKIGFLGEDFQYKLIHHLMNDEVFFRDINGIVDQNIFTDPRLKVFVGLMKDYFETYDYVPSYETMEMRLGEKAHSEIEREQYLSILKKIRNTSDEGEEYVKDLATRFFRQQNIIKAANKILRMAGDGNIDNYTKIVDTLNDALTQGVHEETGSGVYDALDETLSEDYRTTIPTGIDKIDETLEGGIGKGELGVIIGPTSFGKTSLTTAIAANAATCDANNGKGFKVIQIVFEDRLKQIRRKHLARITALSNTPVEAKDLSKPQYIESVRNTINTYKDKDKLRNNLRIVRFPSGEKTVTFIRNFIKKLANEGFKADLVIIDYFECLKMDKESNSESDWEKEGKTMRKIESMAGDLNIAIWVPSQGTKDSLGADLVTMDKMGGSIKKAQIAHIIMSIARTNEDIAENRATISILKNRAGQAGKIFDNVSFNNGLCYISTDDADELGSMYQMDKKRNDDRQMAAENIMKGILAKQKNDKKS